MTAEELDELAAEVGQREAGKHDECHRDCYALQALEIARGYLSLRLVQADHERQIANREAEIKAVREGYAALQEQYAQRVDHMAALQAAYDDVQAALMKSIANTERAQSLLLTYTNF